MPELDFAREPHGPAFKIRFFDQVNYEEAGKLNEWQSMTFRDNRPLPT